MIVIIAVFVYVSILLGIFAVNGCTQILTLVDSGKNDGDFEPNFEINWRYDKVP